MYLEFFVAFHKQTRIKEFAREAFSDVYVQCQSTVILPQNALLSYKNQLEILNYHHLQRHGPVA